MEHRQLSFQQQEAMDTAAGLWSHAASTSQQMKQQPPDIKAAGEIPAFYGASAINPAQTSQVVHSNSFSTLMERRLTNRPSSRSSLRLDVLDQKSPADGSIFLASTAAVRSFQPQPFSYLGIMVLGVVTLAWLCASSALIFLNKYLLVDLGFHYPMFLSGLGMLCSSVCSFALCKMLGIAAPAGTMDMYGRKILPVGLITAISLQTGNITYLYLSISLIQMLKALTPVITMVMAFTAGLERPTWKLIFSVLIISCGTLIASVGTVNALWVGFIFMFISQITEAARLVYTELFLNKLQLSPFVGVMYLAPACLLWLSAGCLVHEWPQIIREDKLQVVWDHPGLVLGSACLGFVVNTLSISIIKLSSGLTLKVSEGSCWQCK
jgi:drug/metabolite transporter (DMT)-like permease